MVFYAFLDCVHHYCFCSFIELVSQSLSNHLCVFNIFQALWEVLKVQRRTGHGVHVGESQISQGPKIFIWRALFLEKNI